MNTMRMPRLARPTRLTRANIALARTEARLWSEARDVRAETKRCTRNAYRFADVRLPNHLRQRASLLDVVRNGDALGTVIALAWYAVGTLAT